MSFSFLLLQLGTCIVPFACNLFVLKRSVVFMIYLFIYLFWQATDDNSAGSPFSNYKIGQTLTARIVSKGIRPENVKGCYGWELSIKPSLLKGNDYQSCSSNAYLWHDDTVHRSNK